MLQLALYPLQPGAGPFVIEPVPLRLLEKFRHAALRSPAGVEQFIPDLPLGETEPGDRCPVFLAESAGLFPLDLELTELLDVRSAILAADREFYDDPAPDDVFAGLDELVGATR